MWRWHGGTATGDERRRGTVGRRVADDDVVCPQRASWLGVRPDDCVGVEDARAGIEAIRAAGMVAVGVGAGFTEAAMVVDDTRELTMATLERLFSATAQR